MLAVDLNGVLLSRWKLCYLNPGNDGRKPRQCFNHMSGATQSKRLLAGLWHHDIISITLLLVSTCAHLVNCMDNAALRFAKDY